LLALVPTSVPVLRAYAEFLIDVVNSPQLAADVMADADGAEDLATKEHSKRREPQEFVFGAHCELDIGADGISLLSISALSKAPATTTTSVL
jgi:hypothetical protein